MFLLQRGIIICSSVFGCLRVLFFPQGVFKECSYCNSISSVFPASGQENRWLCLVCLASKLVEESQGFQLAMICHTDVCPFCATRWALCASHLCSSEGLWGTNRPGRSLFFGPWGPLVLRKQQIESPWDRKGWNQRGLICSKIQAKHAYDAESNFSFIFTASYPRLARQEGTGTNLSSC